MRMPMRAGGPGSNERRFAELYTKALDRLADPRAPLRIGAMHSLELLGQQYPDHRQAIVDVLCAYVRMPAGYDATVRAAALRVLTGHLRPANPAAFWGGVSLDLAGAWLSDVDLSGCRIDGDLTLSHAVLSGSIRLRGMTVGGTADLRGVSCADHAWFERTTFRGPACLDGATFAADAWFGEAVFDGHASFVAARFGGHAWFGGCTFRGRADFTEAVFRRSAGFRGALALGPASLSGTTFLGPARVSRRGDGWNLTAPGWRVVVDPDNESVGSLLWVGIAALEARAQHTPV